MMKKYLAAIIFTPLVCLVVWTLFLQFSKITGREVTVTITGYDPTDLLSGRYLVFQIDWDKTNCKQFPGDICPQEDFCLEISRSRRECRFYVDENKADTLDTLFRWNQDGLHRFEAVYSYTPGHTPVAKRLLIDGQDWEEYFDGSSANDQ